MINKATAPAAPVDPGTSPPAEVGIRIRQLREAWGMSQRKLAGLAGVTNGAISMIEQDRVSPSVASLRKILEVFGLSLVDFFSDNLATSMKVFYGADETTRLSCGPVTLRQVGGPTPYRKLQLLHEFYEPGGDTGPEMLSHDGEESGIVVRGQIEITVGSQCQTLGPGDGYYFDSRRPHRFRNRGNEQCELVSCCTPPRF